MMVTHQLHYMERVDRVLMLDKGKAVEFDTFSNLMAADGHFVL